MGTPVTGTVGPDATATGDAPVKVGGVYNGVIKTLKTASDGSLVISGGASASELQLLGADGLSVAVIKTLSGIASSDAGLAVTDPVLVAAVNAILGATTDAAVGDANGTINAHIRQVAKLLAATLSVNHAQVAGTTTDTNSGSKSAGTQRVVLATDQPALTNALKVDGSAVAQPVTDNSASLTVDAPLGTPVFATITPNITGGWAINSQTGLTNTKVAVKASAGTFGGYMIYNPNATVAHVQVWDVASGSVTVGTTAPTYVLSIPATSAANLEFTNGVNHATAITVAATTTPTGSTAPGTALVAAFFYK